MSFIVKIFSLVFTLCFISCSASLDVKAKTTQPNSLATDSEAKSVDALAQLAEMERRTGYRLGLGGLEAEIFAQNGNYDFAMYSEYKDWLYSYSNGLLDISNFDIWLEALVSKYKKYNLKQAEQFAKIIKAFSVAKYDIVEANTELLVKDDSFASWVIISSKLENNSATDEEKNLYSMMQSRYSYLPDYWLYASSCKSKNANINGVDVNTKLMIDALERCIALAPSGPNASKARLRMASIYGIDGKSANSIVIPSEVQAAATDAIKTPESLRAILPVLSLPDNPATVFAVGVLKGLCESNSIMEWLKVELAKSSGRLAERLRYIVGA